MAMQEQQSVTETAANMAQQAGDKLDQAVDMAKQQTSSRLDDQRERIAEALYTTAHALRQAGQQLREQEQEPVATLTDRVAEQAERASGYLRSRSLTELIDDIEQMGREQPLLFAGGAFGLGLLGVRFLKSSRRRQQQDGPVAQAATPAPRAALPPSGTGAPYGAREGGAMPASAGESLGAGTAGTLDIMLEGDKEDVLEQAPDLRGVASGS